MSGDFVFLFGGYILNPHNNNKKKLVHTVHLFTLVELTVFYETNIGKYKGSFLEKKSKYIRMCTQNTVGSFHWQIPYL